MRKYITKAYAKVNLGLDILGRRDDGYHLVDMILQSVDIYDVLTLYAGEASELTKIRAEEGVSEDERITMSIRQSSYGERLAANRSNLCIRAAEKIFESALENPSDSSRLNLHIQLEKNIPIAAGMAGGSTDAAAVLRGANILMARPLDIKGLAEIGLSLGADIPFCIEGGCIRAGGIGEELNTIEPKELWELVIAKPPVAVSTAEAYRGFDEAKDIRHPDMDAVELGLEAGDINKVSRELLNVLEEVTKKNCLIIGDIEKIMMENGATAALMTGSGPTVFGLCPDGETAKRAAAAIKDKGLCPECFTSRMIIPEYEI
ncbi:MAG: 4-(cytidine 5'-diphospho)-2-C-methyl-D-erythritol kinase [Lachnospiraceae bacterium]|nr:4-(cytidine 5'-diphospho)-2-C-methyl-D-erythritol kinase [Lachnospiraceae bacterium]